MNMDWQQISSLGIVALSAFLLIRNRIRKHRHTPFASCDSECGCSTSTLIQSIPPERLEQLREERRRLNDRPGAQRLQK